MRKSFIHSYEDIISLENLLEAWREFVRGKRLRKDVQEFEQHLMENVLVLYKDLKEKVYDHSPYEAFNISDPKPRNIHKASVRDRLLHHAIYRILYPHFDKLFISDSYSCRLNKGTHKALERFKRFTYKASKNNTRTCWVLKCDIKKFFASIDHTTLLDILKEHVEDEGIRWLFGRVIESFETKPGVGLPLGNLTSQLMVNIYMNEFDQWMKHTMSVKFYIRYADDFVILSHDKDELLELLPKIAAFLEEELRLMLHPDKVFTKTLASGVDFLGWVHFPDHRVIRTATKKRIFRGLKVHQGDLAAVQSYLGLLRHGNARKLIGKIDTLFFKNVF